MVWGGRLARRTIRWIMPQPEYGRLEVKRSCIDRNQPGVQLVLTSITGEHGGLGATIALSRCLSSDEAHNPAMVVATLLDLLDSLGRSGWEHCGEEFWRRPGAPYTWYPERYTSDDYKQCNDRQQAREQEMTINEHAWRLHEFVVNLRIIREDDDKAPDDPPRRHNR
jgi:hypothetical protein